MSSNFIGLGGQSIANNGIGTGQRRKRRHHRRNRRGRHGSDDAGHAKDVRLVHGERFSSLTATIAHANATPATAATPASGHTTIPAPAAIMAHPAAPSRSTVVSLEASDADVPLESLRRDLTAALDTFLLDHLARMTYRSLPTTPWPSPTTSRLASPRRLGTAPTSARLARPHRHPWSVWPPHVGHGDFSVLRLHSPPVPRPRFPVESRPRLPSPCPVSL